MAYAEIADVEAILPDGEEVPGAAQERLKVLLLEATDLVAAYIRQSYGTGLEDPEEVPDDVPGAVRRVTARVALRAYLDVSNTPGAVAETNLMGPFSHTINWSSEASSRDLYLTRADEERLEPYALGYTSGVRYAPMAGASGSEVTQGSTVYPAWGY